MRIRIIVEEDDTIYATPVSQEDGVEIGEPFILPPGEYDGVGCSISEFEDNGATGIVINHITLFESQEVAVQITSVEGISICENQDIE